MSNILYAPEPNRLHLIWQSSSAAARTKFVVGELVRSGASVSLSYHWYSADFANAQMAGFEGHPAFPMSQPTHHNNVLEIFARRIPPRNRSDYNIYLAKHRLPTDRHLTDFTVLGYTGGSLPSDGFQCAIDFKYEAMPLSFIMEVAGFRYNQGMGIEISQLLGQPVAFIPEPTNQVDPNAMAIYMGAVKLGYVPRYYAELFRLWSQRNMTFALIERIDGTLMKPQVFIFVHVLSNHASRRITTG